MYEVAENRLSLLYPTDQPLDTQDGLFTGVDVAKMSIEDLQAMGKFISAVGNAYVMVLDARTKEIITRTKENVARKAIIDAEIVQLREKRVAAAIPDAAPRHKLPRVEPTLDQNGPLLFQKRWSISHAILRAVCEDVGSECAPPLEDVFALVEKWFANRWKRWANVIYISVPCTFEPCRWCMDGERDTSMHSFTRDTMINCCNT